MTGFSSSSFFFRGFFFGGGLPAGRFSRSTIKDGSVEAPSTSSQQPSSPQALARLALGGSRDQAATLFATHREATQTRRDVERAALVDTDRLFVFFLFFLNRV